MALPVMQGRPRVGQKTNPAGFIENYGGIQQPTGSPTYGPLSGLQEAGQGGESLSRETAKYGIMPWQSGSDLQASSQNQMVAAAAPLDLNAVRDPMWQKYDAVLEARGATTGGNRPRFRVPESGPSPEDYANYSQQAMRGLATAGQNPFAPLPPTPRPAPPRNQVLQASDPYASTIPGSTNAWLTAQKKMLGM